MGACGCGDFHGDLSFPAPDGDVYVLDVYPGCDDCDAPAGVVLYRFTAIEAERWGIAGANRLHVTQDGVGIPVMSQEVLRHALKKEAAAGLADLVGDIISDGVRNHFRDASMKTYADWLKEREKRRAPGREGAPP